MQHAEPRKAALPGDFPGGTPWVSRWLTVGLICLLVQNLPAQTNKSGAGASAAETMGCKSNLLTIYKAIKAYQNDRKDLPNWLSDLVPDYLSDPNLLVCPFCRRTGRVEPAPLADPKLASSYLFEFCPVPLGGLLPNDPDRTRREWKRRQMGVLGSVVPVLRCRHHQPALNVSFDGNLYESPPSWEMVFTNLVAADDLTPRKLFAAEKPGSPAVSEAKPEKPPSRFPPRPAQAKPWQIDLTWHYTTGLTERLHRTTNNTLSSLPSGLQTFGGVEFDVRGVIQLASKTLTNRNYPTQVTNIVVKQKCKRLHFLHAAGIGTAEDEGQQVGAYLVRYSGNQARLEIPIQYGQDVRDWHSQQREPKPPEQLVTVWTGTNQSGNRVRLFKTTWNNLAPNTEIQSFDFVSRMIGAAPFLVAVTAEQ